MSNLDPCNLPAGRITVKGEHDDLFHALMHLGNGMLILANAINLNRLAATQEKGENKPKPVTWGEAHFEEKTDVVTEELRKLESARFRQRSGDDPQAEAVGYRPPQPK